MGVVLLFHDFAENSIDPLQFPFSNLEGLLNEIKQNGFEFGKIADVITPESDKLVAVSIDDGFVSSLRATEILNKHGIKPTIFINPMELGNHNSWRRNTMFETKIINKKQLKKLTHMADIGLHGWRHESLLSMNLFKVIIQTFYSIAWFFFFFKFHPQFFSYPFGDANLKTAVIMNKFFKGTFLSSYQIPDSRIGIPRLEIYSVENTKEIITKIKMFSQTVCNEKNTNE